VCGGALGSEFHRPGDRCVSNKRGTDAAVLGDREFDGSSGFRVCGAGRCDGEMQDGRSEASRGGRHTLRFDYHLERLNRGALLSSIVTTSVDAQVAMDASSTSKGPGAVDASPSIRILGPRGRPAWNSRPPTHSTSIAAACGTVADCDFDIGVNRSVRSHRISASSSRTSRTDPQCARFP